MDAIPRRGKCPFVAKAIFQMDLCGPRLRRREGGPLSHYLAAPPTAIRKCSFSELLALSDARNQIDHPGTMRVDAPLGYSATRCQYREIAFDSCDAYRAISLFWMGMFPSSARFSGCHFSGLGPCCAAAAHLGMSFSWGQFSVLRAQGVELRQRPGP